MGILIDRTTRVLVQGITGVGGREHTRTMVEYGTNVVAGVSPGRGGELVHGVPVFNTCLEAMQAAKPELSVVFVGRAGALDAVCEATESGVGTVVCMEEYVPVHDVLKMLSAVRETGARLVGPNCNGIVTPAAAKVGFFPAALGRPGTVGVVSRSGTLSYGAMLAIENAGLGESTVVGIGGAAVRGLSFTDCLALFESDEDTDCVVLLGEIGGREEERAATSIASGYPKPVIALIVGRIAPIGVPMGHSGALVTGSEGSWASKVGLLREAGATVVSNLDALSAAVRDVRAPRLGAHR